MMRERGVAATRNGIATALILTILHYALTVEAAPPLRNLFRYIAVAEGLAEERVFEIAARRLETDPIEKMRLSKRFTQEDLARIRLEGATGVFERDRSLLEYFRAHPFEPDEFGKLEFVNTHIRAYQRISREFELFTSHNEQLREAKILPMNSLEQLGMDAIDRRRAASILHLAQATRQPDFVVVLGHDYNLLAIGKLGGRPVYGEIASNIDLTLDEIVAKLGGSDSSWQGGRALFIDESASGKIRLKPGEVGQWVVYQGRLNRVPVWDNVYADEGPIKDMLLQAGRVRINRSRRLALNLVDDLDTGEEFARVLSAHSAVSIRPEDFSVESIE